MVGGTWSSWPGWAATSHWVPMDGLHRRNAAGPLTPLVTACLRQEKSQTAKPLPLQVGVVQVLVGVVRANRGGGVCQPPCSHSVLLHWCLLCHTSCASCAAFCTPFPALAERSACLRARRPCRPAARCARSAGTAGGAAATAGAGGAAAAAGAGAGTGRAAGRAAAAGSGTGTTAAAEALTAGAGAPAPGGGGARMCRVSYQWPWLACFWCPGVRVAPACAARIALLHRTPPPRHTPTPLHPPTHPPTNTNSPSLAPGRRPLPGDVHQRRAGL